MAGEDVAFTRHCDARLKFSLILNDMLFPCSHKVIAQGHLFLANRVFQCVGCRR